MFLPINKLATYFLVVPQDTVIQEFGPRGHNTPQESKTRIQCYLGKEKKNMDTKELGLVVD